MAFTRPPDFTTRPDLAGTFGMTSSTHWLATGTAQSVLERGGTAVDAAVAGGFVLHLVEPHLNGPGGDLVGLLAPAGGEPRVLMGQGPAPSGATIAHFRAEGLDLVPGAGALAAAVPGAVDAWLLLLRDHGTWELADVLAPAIDLARSGHPLSASAARTIAAVADLFRDAWPASADHWLVDGGPPEPGVLIRNPSWAAVLERLIDAGRRAPDRRARIDAARDAWGDGFVAAAIERAAAVPHRHAGGTVHAGVIRASDLAGFRASFEPPVTRTFRGRTVAKAGPWSQGPALLQALAILEPMADELLDPSTAAGAHTVLETIGLVMADREAYFGDRDAPLDVLLSAGYADARRALIGPRAAAALRPGDAGADAGTVPPLRTGGDDPDERAAGEPTVRSAAEPRVDAAGVTRGDTCHIAVVDRFGDMVAVTASGGWLQSSPHIPELGFCLGTRLQMTWLDEGSASALAPGRRPRTTLTPTLVLQDGEAVAALGSPGGDQQDQWQLLWLLRTIVGGWTPQQAIDAPALHSTAFPGSFWPRRWTPAGAVAEDRLGDAVLEALEEMGHRVERAGDWALGRLCVVTRDPATGRLGAAANPRGGQGYAAGR